MARSTTSMLDRRPPDRGHPAPGAVPDSPPAARGRAPRWRDARVLLGVGLVAGCVLLGVRVTTAGDASVQVWRATRDLAAGATPTLADLEAVAVPAGDVAAAYLAADGAPDGRLSRDLGAGELVPAAAVVVGAPADVRVVTVPVEPLHAPTDLAAGDRVDVWSTPREDVDSGLARPALVRSGVLVLGVDAGTTGLAGEVGVALEVPAAVAVDLVAAVRSGAVDLVRVPVTS